MNRIVKTRYPLSSGQKAMWFIHQMAPNSVAYNIFITVKINSYLNLNIAAVTHVWKKIIEHHPILRTTYTTHEGEAVQQINQQKQFNLEVTNASNWNEDHLKEKIFAITDRPFDLEKDAVLRVNLFTRSEKEHILLLTMHHIAGDMWSFDLLLSEFQALYTAEIEPTNRQQTQAAKDSWQKNKSYLEFVQWQSEMLSSARGQKLWQYWQEQLSGELPILNLLADKPRPPIQTYQGSSHISQLDEQLIQKLKNLALASGTSLYIILLTAFYVLLYRYTNQTEILIGSPMRGRWGGDFQEIVGYFVNLTVLRTAVQKNATFKEFLAQVSKTVKDAQNHQDYPFSLIAEQLQPQRDPSRSPLCQVSFTWQRQRWCESTENSLHSQEQVLQMEPYLLGHQRGADWDLNLMVMEAQGVFQLCWQYNTDLFEITTITRMAGHFVTLLEGIVANPIQQIWQLPLLREVERQQLLVEWNSTQTDYPQDKCIHQLFEQQVARTPDAVAVVFDNQQLTYSELNCRANQLAHHLKSLGVGADVLVGLCVERSPLMIVGMLGILKAGGAYVPLDPEYPQARLSFMLEDTQVKVLLTQHNLVESLPQHQAHVICLDTQEQIISLANQDNLNSTLSAENLSYVIYTSGSTGTPKGVMVEHKGLCNLAQAQIQTFGLDCDSRILQFASLSFDASISEVVMALGSGATLYLGMKDSLMPGISLMERLRDNSITHITLPPSALAVLPTEELRALQTMIVAGEACSVELIKKWSAGRNFFNAYGPTEATVCATIAKCTLDDEKIPIGRAIANTQVYILDSHLQPVPIGVPGELYLGGAGLARGYLNRSQLTQEKFIANPFEETQSSRLYKTGDLGRYLPDGNIEYLGRIDNQVKIRGLRIELGEIETVLSQHGDVQANCVIAREDNTGDKQLVAYIVAQPEATPKISELRQFLKAKLPDYMLPQAFVLLEALPLTLNGKIDHRALPTPDLESIRLEKYVAPRTPVEEILTQIWAQVLKVEQIGIHDNFFEIGGHSLLATQLVSRIRTCLKVELPLRKLFGAATVAQLAHLIAQLQQQNSQLSAPPIVPRTENAQLALSYAQQRLWFLDQFEPDSPFYNIPIALCLAGTVQVAALEQSLIEIIKRHEALRTNFITVDGQPTQIIQTQTNWRLSVVDLQHLSTNEQEIAAQKLAQQQAQTPFDLANESLITATLVVQSQTKHILSVCMHHIVCDGWSMGVFVQELAALYNAYSIGQPSPLAPLEIQYADFAIWQRNWLVGEVLQNQLSYWQQQLKDAPALLSLPSDRPRPAVQTFAGAYQEFRLSVELTTKLTKLSQQQGVTLFMTLLAAFDTLVYRYTGTEDILVGTPIANRDRSEIEGLIGFFVNTLVMRTDLSGNPSFSQLLSRVRSMAMDAYAHQNLPFEMLVEALQPERELSHSPLFQVMFALQNASISEVELTGLSVTSLPIETATAKFDLTLSMENTPEGLMGVWEYSTDLFDKSTIERMMGHFVTLLEGIVANPTEQISTLPMLTESERQQLLVEWNDTLLDYPHDKCIHQLFSEQVERTPDAVAVVFENVQTRNFASLTYRQLNCRANQLAHHLKSLGVGADVLVGLCVERSLEMIVGLLGILKAGGAYVPLDPEYPTERLSFMLEDAQLKLVLTQQQLVERLPLHTAHLVCLDTDNQEFVQGSEIPNPCEVKQSNLAYVLYTSGSTGRPKAVAIEHHSPVALVSWAQKVFTPLELAGVLASTSICFDLSVFELFVTLSLGGKIILAQNALHLSTMTVANQVTLINTVPSAIAQLIRENSLPQQVCTVNLAGEPLQNQLVQQIYQHSQVERVFNLYGPSEDTTYSTFSLIEKGTSSSPTIGRAIANTQIYILDSHLQPVPIGVPGELHIGGAGLARGYLNRSELTQQKFIPNPFGGSRGAERLYKTGDLACYLPDGNIEYLGRIDNQIKIRGFRIELGEIEAVLSQHSDVQACCVIAHEDTPGDTCTEPNRSKRLVAYVVTHQQHLPTVSQLCQFLSNQLPQYMVPQTFVMLETLPLTPNGKVNRRALPAPESREGLEVSFVAPRNRIEEILATIWSQVLRVEQVGIHDSFFELGGDSILSIQIINRAMQAGLQLTLKQLVAHKTIAQLAAVAGTTKALEIEQGLVTGTLPLTPIQQWFFEQKLSQPHHFNQSFLLSVPSNLKPELLEQVWQELLRHHDALRLRFTHSQSSWQQTYSAPTDSVAFSFVDLSTLSDSKQQEAIAATAISFSTDEFESVRESGASSLFRTRY
jgi:amino acid adenylation domain-containing protein